MDDDWGRTAHALMFGLVAGLAWLRARRHPAHLLIVALFVWDLIANGLRLAFAPVVYAPDTPFGGATRVIYYLDHGLVLSFRFLLLTICDRHFLRGPWSRVPIVALSVWIALIVYKELTQGSLVPAHHAIAAGVALTGWLMIGRAVLAPAAELRAPDGVHAVLVLVLTAELVNVALNYVGPLEDTWRDVRAVDLLVHGVVLVGYAGILCREGASQWPASRS